MKPRERMLAIGVAALVGLLILNTIYSQVSEAFTQRNGQKTALEEEIRKKEETIHRGQRAEKNLSEWRKQSLPSNSQLAESLYYQWLLQLKDRVKLESAQVDPMPTLGRNKAYEKHAFRIKAEGDIALKQLARFLYEFYSANHLQQVKQLTIKPKPDGSKVDLTIDIEALQIPGADRTDKLAPGRSKVLQLANEGAYEKTIGDRNLFVAYRAPQERREVRPQVDPPKPKFDIAKYAKVTGIVEDSERPQIWVSVQTTGEVLKLSEGQEFKVGDIDCKVEKIGVRDAVVTVAGKAKQVKLEDNLRDAAEISNGEL